MTSEKILETPTSIVKETLNYRYERKYLTVDLNHGQVLFLIQNNPLGFKEIYSQRRVNNIYFDTLGMQSYHDNVDGATNRKKYRIRWYGTLNAEVVKPVLECKIKKGQIGTKESYPLRPFVLDRSFNRNVLEEVLSGTGVPDVLKHELLSMQPTIVNSYVRNYFLSFCKRFRITLDFDLSYRKIAYNKGISLIPVRDTNSVVLEAKYDSEANTEAQKELDFSPIQLTKSSKYVMGVNWLFGNQSI